MAEGVVGLLPDGAGKKVDTSELTRADGTVVERQRAVIGDAYDPLALGRVDAAGNLWIDTAPLLIEARKHTALLTALVLQLASVTGVTITLDDILEA